jgi:hypothetical protein
MRERAIDEPPRKLVVLHAAACDDDSVAVVLERLV